MVKLKLFFGITKAFDLICHNSFLVKRNAFVVGYKFFPFIGSFFSDQTINIVKDWVSFEGFKLNFFIGLSF